MRNGRSTQAARCSPGDGPTVGLRGQASNNSMQLTALRAAANAGRSADNRDCGRWTMIRDSSDAWPCVTGGR